MSHRQAKFYSYRNLNKGISFSTKHKGLVVFRFESAIAENVDLVVSEAGNKRAVSSGKRNVHAYAVTNLLPKQMSQRIDVSDLCEIKYNPFKSSTFLVDGLPVTVLRKYYFRMVSFI